MKKTLLLLFTLSIFIIGCDGRKSHSESLQESIENFKDSIRPIEIIIYSPETYSEIVTDTILSNGFRINIKTYSDMEHNVLDSVTKDSIVNKHYYREFKSVLTVYKNDEEIFSKNVDKPFFYKQYKSHEEILKDMILKTVRVNQSTVMNYQIKKYESDVDEAHIEFHYCNIKDDYCLRYLIRVSSNGEFSISNFEY